jgi:hypothetical protein
MSGDRIRRNICFAEPFAEKEPAGITVRRNPGDIDRLYIGQSCSKIFSFIVGNGEAVGLSGNSNTPIHPAAGFRALDKHAIGFKLCKLSTHPIAFRANNKGAVPS